MVGFANRRLQPLGHLTVRGFPKDFAISLPLATAATGYLIGPIVAVLLSVIVLGSSGSDLDSCAIVLSI